MRGVGSEQKASTQLRQTAAQNPQRVLPSELLQVAIPIPAREQAATIGRKHLIAIIVPPFQTSQPDYGSPYHTYV